MPRKLLFLVDAICMKGSLLSQLNEYFCFDVICVIVSEKVWGVWLKHSCVFKLD